MKRTVIKGNRPQRNNPWVRDYYGLFYEDHLRAEGLK